MMNPRENYLAYLNHEETDYVPNMYLDLAMAGGQLEWWENGPITGGEDGFGCKWIPTESAGGQPALDPFCIILDDVCDWEDVVKFPDLDAIDWEEYAGQQLKDVDRENKVLEYHTWNSVYLRFAHLLGFENALCSLYEEPEASKDLINAIADYKIRLIDYVAKYIKPDSMITYDDIATERSTFMSPDAYREFFKEPHKRMADAMLSYGIIPQKHTCGRCEEVLDDYIDEGIAAWQSAQPSNDLCGILETKGDKIGVMGGYDTQGKPAAPDATPEEVIAEVDRCYEVYGSYGRGYGFFGFVLGDPSSATYQANMGAMIQHSIELRQQGK